MKNKKIKRIVKRVVLTLLVSAVGIVTAGGVYSEKVFDDISSNVVRLHVIANSNSEYDQQLKLKVRDAVVEYSGEALKNCESQQDVLLLLERDMENIKSVAEDCLKREGSGYEARVSVGKCEFPAKSYGKYCFPDGEYQALRIEIGGAEGRNWWCVLFPPLCYISENAVSVSSDAEQRMRENLSEEAFDTVNGEMKNDMNENEISEKSGINNGIKVSYKFKIVEFFKKITKFFN
ncbi:MAG: stage II sporulation protein R [Ruminococcaceae bacterium]|nr:stage II sporulation protein R [Oscillospiraceae bacterium]